MKRILITGANSYIGTSFEKWLARYPKEYEIDTVDMASQGWREKSFSDYDVIFHVAGIAHADTSKISDEDKELYYRVNCELTYETANKAKMDGVKQFIFMSSMIVYGESDIAGQRMITSDTVPVPGNFYGDSKLQAEKKLAELMSDQFHVVILRPPMIYGRNSKGNYLILSKIAQKLPLFPDLDNRRSMLYIDNLCEFVRLMAENEEVGTFYPQNSDYVKTSDMVKLIADEHGNKILMFRWMNWLIKILGRMPGKVGKLVNKAFGSLTYDMNMSKYKDNYRLMSFAESIKETEGIRRK